MLFWCKNRCSSANCRACARVKCLDCGRQNSRGQGKVVEKGLESHFRGEVGCCPVGWWPGNSWRNPLACYVLVRIIYYSMVENAHILCSLLFFFPIMYRGLGLAVRTLRDVSVSLSTQALQSYFCFVQIILCNWIYKHISLWRGAVGWGVYNSLFSLDPLLYKSNVKLSHVLQISLLSVWE